MEDKGWYLCSRVDNKECPGLLAVITSERATDPHPTHTDLEGSEHLDLAP